jgi:hypothetical protein
MVAHAVRLPIAVVSLHQSLAASLLQHPLLVASLLPNRHQLHAASQLLLSLIVVVKLLRPVPILARSVLAC